MTSVNHARQLLYPFRKRSNSQEELEQVRNHR